MSLCALWAFALCACAGEGEGSGSPEGALRLEFPGQAALILDGAAAFELVPSGESFVARGQNGLATIATPRGGLQAVLPTRGSDPVRFRLPGDQDVLVREVGVSGEARVHASALTYRREGGTSYWAATDAGYEEWLLLEAGRAYADQAMAAWEIEGATVRQQGELVEVLNARGEARLRVAAPAAFAAGGREVTARLSARGTTRIELSVDAEGEAVLADPSWTLTSAMITPRIAHITAALPGGYVLAAGGMTSMDKTVSASEIYDPATDAWKPTGAMVQARDIITSVTLPSSGVFVAGGVNAANKLLATAETYSPASGEWTAAGTMSMARVGPVLTVLSSGKVLVTGGQINGANGATITASAEVYDPAKNTWAPCAPMSGPRVGHQATLLPSGEVLVTGGSSTAGFAPLSATALYNPVTNTWKPAASMLVPRTLHSAVQLTDGRVLVVDAQEAYLGEDNEGVAEIYDPTSGAWTPAGPTIFRGESTALVLLASGKVLRVVFTFDAVTSLAEIYDPEAGAWTVAKPLVEQRRFAGAALLPNGKVVMAGGCNVPSPPLVAFAEVYDPGASLGAPCAQPVDCESGFCSDGVCCDTACDAGACDACSVKAGAAADGECESLEGQTCDDGDPCTQGEVCKAGECAGAQLTCAPFDECHEVGACDPSTGLCSSPRKPNGASCPGGTCEEGRCEEEPVTGAGTGPESTEPPIGDGRDGCQCGTAGSSRTEVPLVTALLALAALRRRRARLQA